MKHKYLWIIFIFISCFALLAPLQLLVDFSLPFTEAVQGLFVMIGAYLLCDATATFYTSSKMKAGEKYEESEKKVSAIMIALLIIFIEYHILQFFITDLALPLGALWVGVGSNIAVIFGGAKSNNLAENMGESK